MQPLNRLPPYELHTKFSLGGDLHRTIYGYWSKFLIIRGPIFGYPL